MQIKLTSLLPGLFLPGLLLPGLFLILAVTGCSNTKTSYDYDSNYDFSQVKTYQWNTKPSANFASGNPLT